MSGDATNLALTLENKPGETFFPQLLEGDINISYSAVASTSPAVAVSDASGDSSSSSSSGSGGRDGTGSDGGGGGGEGLNGDGEDGVVWLVKALWKTASTTLLDWTIFPSTGLLLPGQRCVQSA